MSAFRGEASKVSLSATGQAPGCHVFDGPIYKAILQRVTEEISLPNVIRFRRFVSEGVLKCYV